MNPTAIREALADVLQGLSVNCYPYKPSGITPPFIMIRAADDYLTFHETWHRAGVQRIRFQLDIVAVARPEDAEQLLDELVTFGAAEERSVFEALKADRTLGGLVDNIAVVRVTGVVDGELGPTASILLDVYPKREGL